MNRRQLLRSMLGLPLVPFVLLESEPPSPFTATSGFIYTEECRFEFEDIRCRYNDSDTTKYVDLSEFVQEVPPMFTITYVEDLP